MYKKDTHHNIEAKGNKIKFDEGNESYKSRILE